MQYIKPQNIMMLLVLQCDRRVDSWGYSHFKSKTNNTQYSVSSILTIRVSANTVPCSPYYTRGTKQFR